VAAVRYRHVMADRDAAIARELNRLIESGSLERRRGGPTGLVVRGYVSFR
jgi:hypothetical protein